MEGKDKQFLMKRVNDLQSSALGIRPNDIPSKREQRTADVLRQRNTLSYENEDARSSASSLPGQTGV